MSVRQLSVQTLEQIISGKIFFNAVKDHFNAKELPFANMLILSALRHFNPLQKIVTSYLRKPLPETQKSLKYVMICAATEILLMKTPDYAVINEYVKIAKQLSNRFAGGMVNAILRKIVQNKIELGSRLNQNLMPDNFRQIMKKDYTTEVITLCENQIGQEAPLDISVKTDPEFWATKLNGVLFANGTVRLNNLDEKISQLDGYNEGAWWVQDLAASLPVKLLGDVQGLKILDLCAAPGGKTAQLLSGGADVTAVDIDPERLRRLEENMNRLRLRGRLATRAGDGLSFLKQTSEAYDVIVLDAPCSATGTYRRHPEVLHIKSQNDVSANLKIQRELLAAATLKLNANGRILYCTCSLAKDEGEKQAAWFTENYPNFELAKTDESLINVYPGIKLEKFLFDKGVLRTLPYYMQKEGGMDAFFAACFQKKNK